MTVSFRRLVSETLDRCRSHLELAVVPFVAAFLKVHHVRDVLADPADVRFGISFAVPFPIVDVWSFTSGGGSGINVVAPEPPFLFVFPVVVLLEAALMAVYVGSLDDVLLTGRYDAGSNLRAYLPRFVAFHVAVTALVLGVGAFGLGAVQAGGAGAAVVLFLFVLVGAVGLSYLFYAAPFLFVVEEHGVVPAFRRSYALATEGGDYATFWLKHVGAGVAVSVPITALVHNVPLLGIPLGAAIAAPIGLVFTGATLRFLHQHVGDDVGQPADSNVRHDPL